MGTNTQIVKYLNIKNLLEIIFDSRDTDRNAGGRKRLGMTFDKGPQLDVVWHMSLITRPPDVLEFPHQMQMIHNV